MPCCRFWPVDEKQAYVDSTHLNSSDKVSRIIYGADEMHIIINTLLINYHFDLTLFIILRLKCKVNLFMNLFQSFILTFTLDIWACY